jgi:uncharacterized protein YodC (DUF2158 family)
MDFQPGDVVILRSGGPKMTVSKITKRAIAKKDLVFCVWFNRAGKKIEGAFYGAALTISG